MNTKSLLALAIALASAAPTSSASTGSITIGNAQEPSRPAAAPAPSKSSSADETPRSLGSLLEGVRSKTGVPGLSAAAVRGGKIVAVGVSGVRELGKTDAIAVGDRFLVGSCTKAMTRLLYGRLIQAGKMAPEATLPELLPGVPMRDEYKLAKLADVVRHTAGLQPYTRITPKTTPIVFELGGAPAEARGKFVEHLLQEAPAAEVGKKFVYSNAGYALLGNAAERRLGKPWEELIAKEVFEPLAMKSATIGLPRGKSEQAKAGVPIGHSRGAKGYEVEPDGPPVDGLFAPAGGVVLSIEDFARFAIAESAVEKGDAGSFLGKETCAKLSELRLRDGGGEEGAVFFGGQGTYTAAFAVWPSQSFGVVVCSNGGESDDACRAAVDAVRASCAPEIEMAPRPVLAGGPGRKLGVQMRATPGDSLVIVAVEPGSLAEKGGLQVDDEIVAIDGKPIADLSQEEIAPAIRAPKAKITVMRAEKKVELVMPE
jgi:CubicO group peptidase (beta-lactamase class C family)